MLLDEVKKYLAHKMVLAECSFYYHQASMKASVQWGYGMRELLKYKAQWISERDLAIMIRQNKTHLENLLPSPNNKSYESSVSNFNKIINHCSELLQPKTARV